MRVLALLPLLAIAACTTPGGNRMPVEAMRYHRPTGVPPGTTSVEPGRAGLMSQPYEVAVQRLLAQNGFPAAAAGTQSRYITVVDVRQREAQGPARRSSFSIGIGGGGFTGGRGGGGVGLGGGIGFPIGGGGSARIVETELTVRIKDRADQTVLWEGNARTAANLRRPEGADAAVADRLATALFKDFPGEAGIPITVP